MTHADEFMAAVLNDHLNGVGTSIQLEGDGRWYARSQNGDHVSSNSVADLVAKIVDSYFYLRDRLPSGGI